MKCEVCKETERQWILKDVDSPKIIYNFCSNCHFNLVNLNLSPEQFFNLLESEHSTKEFLLHSDFYDEDTGEALQPKI